MSDTISVQELKLLAPDGNLLLLDVRRKADKDAMPEMIPNAIWKDPELVQEWAKDLDSSVGADAELIIYCARGGSVSKATLSVLREHKKKVRFIEGGIEAWQKV